MRVRCISGGTGRSSDRADLCIQGETAFLEVIQGLRVLKQDQFAVNLAPNWNPIDTWVSVA